MNSDLFLILVIRLLLIVWSLTAIASICTSKEAYGIGKAALIVTHLFVIIYNGVWLFLGK